MFSAPPHVPFCESLSHAFDEQFLACTGRLDTTSSSDIEPEERCKHVDLWLLFVQPAATIFAARCFWSFWAPKSCWDSQVWWYKTHPLLCEPHPCPAGAPWSLLQIRLVPEHMNDRDLSQTSVHPDTGDSRPSRRGFRPQWGRDSSAVQVDYQAVATQVPSARVSTSTVEIQGRGWRGNICSILGNQNSHRFAPFLTIVTPWLWHSLRRASQAWGRGRWGETGPALSPTIVYISEGSSSGPDYSWPLGFSGEIRKRPGLMPSWPDP